MYCLLLFIVCIVWDVESLDNSYDPYRKVYIKVYLGGASYANFHKIQAPELPNSL